MKRQSESGLSRLSLLVAIALILVTGGLLRLFWMMAQTSHPPTAIISEILSTSTPFQPDTATQTPFRPVKPTATATSTPLPTATPFPSSFMRFGIDFQDETETIKMVLSPVDEKLNNGRPIRINFIPGWPCEWINQRGCTSLHYQGQVVLATIHSGVLGAGQSLRHALEGTWLNAASHTLGKVQDNLASLIGSQAQIEQGNALSGEVRVIAAVRLPANQVDEYFSLPVDQALDMAAQSSSELAKALDSKLPLLVIETCGWRHPAEKYEPGTSDTSASVYLIVIGE